MFGSLMFIRIVGFVPPLCRLKWIGIIMSFENCRRASTEWTPPGGKHSSWKRIRAGMLKTFNRMKRRVGFLIYQFVLPALQVSLFCLAIGQDPKDLPFAVVNAENQARGPCPASNRKNQLFVYIFEKIYTALCLHFWKTDSALFTLLQNNSCLFTLWIQLDMGHVF